MKYQWRLLLLRSYRSCHRPLLSHDSRFQVIPNSTRSFTSSLHERSGFGALQQNQCLLDLPPPVTISVGRSFSSDKTSATEDEASAGAVVIDVFSRLSSKDKITKELDSNNIVISHDLVLEALRSLESSPDVAARFFRWVLEDSPRKISSKSYNTMLLILGVSGLVDEFWKLVDDMKKKGHGVSANVRDKVGEKFQKDGLKGDLNRLKEIFASGSIDNSVYKVCNRVCKIVMKNEWNADLEKQLRDLKIKFNSDLVKMIVEKLDMEPRKALLFFRWIDESGSFKHDEKTYNAMARVLGREKFLDRFQNLLEETRSAGYEMEMETYVRVSARFCQTKMIKEAVELFEFAMAGGNTPTAHCCSLLLKKICTSKTLDMVLFSRTVKAYTGNGNVVTDSMMQSVLKSLRSVDRIGQSKEVLKAMNEGGGYIPSGNLQSVIVSGLSRKGKKDEANELVEFMDASGNPLDDKAMASLVEGHCDAGDLEEASACFKKMIGKEGVSYAGYAFEKLVLAYCNSFEARDAYKLFTELVKQNQKLKPWHSTYKIMVRNLLMKKVATDGGFEEALSLVPLMRNQGFPPFVDPFVDYLSSSGTAAEAFAFLEALTSKKFPSNVMVLRVFEAMLKSGRHREAQDLLSLSPSYVRRNADVLQLFSSMKPGRCSLEKPLPSPAQIEA